MRRESIGRLGAFAAALLACGDDGPYGGGMMGTTPGSASDGVNTGLDIAVKAGTGVFGLSQEAFLDGWTVNYTRVLVSLGDASLAVGKDTVDAPLNAVVDLAALPDGGATVTHVEVREAGSAVEFSVVGVTPETDPLGSWTSEEDAAEMVKGGYVLLIEGTIEKKDGLSCDPGTQANCSEAPLVRFRWGSTAGARFLRCGGFGSPTTKAANVTFTLPATTWLQTAFLGTDVSSGLRAQWIADADLNRDGETTLEELANVKASAAFTADLGYDLSRAPSTIETALDFFEQQARTIGINAWGRCSGVAAL